jgi:hypothetical protein
MIRKSTAVWGITLAAALGVAGCESDKDRNKAQEQGQMDPQKRLEQQGDQKTTEALLKEKDEYRTSLEKAITDQQKVVDEMRQGAANATGETKVEDEHELQDVMKRRESLQSDMREVAAATPEKWPALKDKIDRDIDEYKDTVKTASSRIKATPGRAQQQPSGTAPTPHTPPTPPPSGAPTTTPTGTMAPHPTPTGTEHPTK